GSGRRAQLPFVDEVDEHVARFRFRLTRPIHERKVIGYSAFSPEPCSLGPLVELAWGIGGGELVVGPLQTRVDHVAGEIGDRGKVLGFGEDGADAVLAQKRDELWRAEARMARLDHMVERLPFELARQMVEEFGEVVFVESLERRELPEHGT